MWPMRVKETATAALARSAVDLRLLFRRPCHGPVLRAATVEGAGIIVRADEDVGRELYLFGKFERRETEWFRNAIQENDICMDVGANCGHYTVLMSRRATRGHVYAFEPIRTNCQLLLLNVSVNGLHNVTIEEAAVADHEGRSSFVIAEDSGFSSLKNTGRKPVRTEVIVDVTTIDSYCSTHKLHRIDCLKVDVEGAEGSVLGGARRLLSDHDRRPRVIMLELNDAMLQIHGSSRRDLIALLRGYGYDAFTCAGDQLCSLPLEDEGASENVLFIRKG
jgi:FkbM family methyltransferase